MRRYFIATALVAAAAGYAGPGFSDESPSSVGGVDEHTVALWLFDEPSYANVTLTDAGPHQLDLRLETGYKQPVPEGLLNGRRGLSEGRFGKALHLPLGGGMGVIWAEGTAIDYGISRMLDRENEVPEVCNLGALDYTFEFWFKSDGPQPEPGVLWEVRNPQGPDEYKYIARGFNALMLDAGRTQFLLRSVVSRLGETVWDQRLPLPSDPAKLNDGRWHHVAFTYTAAEAQMRHYFDGRLQPLPERGGFLPLMGQLVSMRLGRDAEGKQEMHGLLDEVRISKVVRYKEDFTPPGSFARNYGPGAPAPVRPDGPPLLFASEAPAGPVALGGRKHLFIDGALLERAENVAFVSNPPTRIDVTDFRCDRPWDATPRFGSGIPDICSFWDEGGEIRMLYSNGGMWGGKDTVICLAASEDGLHWTKPELGQVPWMGSTRNNIVLRNACQGTAFKDPNPLEPADRRYKFVAWCMMRGFYVFTSPDGIDWRRNEAAALPFDPDGSISIFWDDQCGLYRGFLRSVRPRQFPDLVRAAAQATTAEIMKPWPFTPASAPDWHSKFALPKPNNGELPLVDTGGQVYRFKGIKYPWAPDTYLAFPWRHVADANVRPGSFLMVSRDAERWQRYEPPYYFDSGWEFEGRKVYEALMEQGMIRRGDEIWQFGTARFTEHGGALYGGVEHDGSGFDRLFRLVQRLDGFVSLDAKEGRGAAVTRPLTFAGRRLELNLAAKGRVRVALLEGGQPIPGFALDDCDPIEADSVRHTVTWKGRSDVSAFAGKPIALQFELQDAKLYAFQFVE